MSFYYRKSHGHTFQKKLTQFPTIILIICFIVYKKSEKSYDKINTIFGQRFEVIEIIDYLDITAIIIEFFLVKQMIFLASIYILYS